MKRIICLLLALVLCLAAFTGCEMIEGIFGPGEQQEPDERIDNALEYLGTMYKDLSGSHAKDFDVASQVPVQGVMYPVTWAADSDEVTIRESVKTNYYTVDIPSDNSSDLTFTLTATVHSPTTDETREKSFEIKVPAATAKDVLSITAALELGKEQGSGKYTTEKYYVSGTVTKIDNTTYGNLYIADEDGNEILVYGTYDATGKVRFDKMSNQPKIGDTVTFYSVVGNYNGTPQLKNAWLTALNGEELGGGEQGGSTSTGIVLDMMGSTNIQSHSATQMIYAANGITLTNDKNTSSTDCYNNTGSYAARFYGGATIKIEYKGMTKIVFTLDDYSPSAGKDYLKGFDGMTVEGATIVRENDIVTIYFAAATDVFQSAPLGSQIRVEQIEIFTGKIETPPTGNEGGNGSGGNGNAGSYEAPVAGKAYKFYLEQTTLGKTLYFAGTMDAEKGTYLATTDNKSAAVDIYFEVVNGGYHIYFMDGNTKTYVNAAAYLKDNGYAGCHFELGTEPICVWTYDTTYGILEVFDEIEGKSDTFFAGTYGEYSTISLSGAYYKDQISSGTQFPARILLSEGGNTGNEGGNTGNEGGNTGNEGGNTGNEGGNTGNEGGNTGNEGGNTGNEGGNTGNEGGNTGNEGGNTGNEGGNTSDTSELNENTEYYISGVNSKGNIYFKGTLTSGRIDATTDVNSAVVVKLESAGADGEYYIYFMDGNTKTYIGANSAATESKTAQFIFGTEKGADYVWILDASAKTIISKAFTGRGIATQVASTHDNFSTYATSNFSNSQYATTWLQVAGEINEGGNTGNEGGNTDNEGGNTDNEGGNTDNEGGNTGNEGTDTPEISGSASLDFSDVANRTSFDTSSQVWEQNGVKLTNNKASSTSNVADYSNPARFYKSSSLTVEYKSIVKIEFVCDSASYANALKASIAEAEGVTVTVNENVVTVEFAEAIDAFTISCLSGGQVRMDSLTVYTSAN